MMDRTRTDRYFYDIAVGLATAQARTGIMNLKSDAFAVGGPVPETHSHEADNVSPPLSWSGAVIGVKSFALVCDDPDAPKAGGWVHWVIWDIPAARARLDASVPRAERLGDGSRQGLNDWREIGWTGRSLPPAHIITRSGSTLPIILLGPSRQPHERVSSEP